MLREANSLAIGVGGGPENDAFEKDFTQLIGCTDSVALSSCTSALELAAILAGLGPGDEVIMPAHTFVATAVPFARHQAVMGLSLNFVRVSSSNSRYFLWSATSGNPVPFTAIAFRFLEPITAPVPPLPAERAAVFMTHAIGTRFSPAGPI